MISKHILTCLLLLLSIPVVSQVQEPVIVNIVYRFVHVSDTNNRTAPIKSEMVLHVGKTNSKYNTMVREKMMQEAVRATKQPVITSGPTIGVVGFGVAKINSKDNDIEDLFQVPSKKLIVRTASLAMQDYIIEAPLPVISWKVENDTRQIGDYTCQKATGTFAGRTYTAWFTTELPFHYGPWKLSGLPGLILEASDAKEEVFFLFKEMSKNADDEEIMVSKSTRIPARISEQEFLRAKKAYERDPVGLFQSRLAPGATPPRIAYQDTSGKTVFGDEANKLIKEDSKRRINNPIELVISKP